MGSGSSKFWIWVLTGILTVGVAVLLNLALGDVKSQIDLTEDQRFTLPQAAADIAGSLEDTCKVTVYLSDSLPSFVDYIPRVLRTRLEEFEKASNGKLVFEFIDPAHDKALKEDLEKRNPPIKPVGGQDVQEGKTVIAEYYLTMVFRYGDQEAVYNLTDLQQALRQEAEFSKMLPFQIAAKIVKLQNPDKKVGIASEKKMLPQELQGQQQKNEPTDGLTTIRESIARHLPKPEDVQVRTGIPIRDDIDTLIIHRPEDLDERAIYEVDQFLMKGKRIILLLDNLSLFDLDRVQDYISSFLQPARSPGGDASSVKVREVKHGMKDWLAHFGVIAGEGYVEDRTNAKSIRNVIDFQILPNGMRIPRGMRQEATDLPGFVVVPERGDDKKPTGQFSETSPALAGLSRVVMAYPVPLTLDYDAVAKHGQDGGGKPRVTAEELLRTSRESWVRKVEDGKVKLFYPPDVTLPEKAEWGSRPLALALHGHFRSYFAEKKYGESDRPPRKGPDGKELPDGPNPPAKLVESASPGQLWVFADADFISDWSLGSQVLPPQNTIAGTLASSGAIQGMAMMMVGLVNILDSMTVGDELVEIRRPQIRDRSVDQVAVDKEAAWIKFKTVALGPLILLAWGFVWWGIRFALTRVPSPTGPGRPAVLIPPAGTGGDLGRVEPAPVGVPSGGAEEVRS
jgi:ABC-2 type transport system permease protein